jgi:hypothetical protein
MWRWVFSTEFFNLLNIAATSSDGVTGSHKFFEHGAAQTSRDARQHNDSRRAHFSISEGSLPGPSACRTQSRDLLASKKLERMAKFPPYL